MQEISQQTAMSPPTSHAQLAGPGLLQRGCSPRISCDAARPARTDTAVEIPVGTRREATGHRAQWPAPLPHLEARLVIRSSR